MSFYICERLDERQITLNNNRGTEEGPEMAAYRGGIKGDRGEVTRQGGKSSGLTAWAKSWTTQIEVNYLTGGPEGKTPRIVITALDLKNGGRRTLLDVPEADLMRETAPPTRTLVISTEEKPEDATPEPTSSMGIFLGGNVPAMSTMGSYYVWFPGGERHLSPIVLAPLAEQIRAGNLKPNEGVKTYHGDHRPLRHLLESIRSGTVVEVIPDDLGLDMPSIRPLEVA